MIFLGLAIRVIPMGTAYAVWTGIGVIGITTYGIYIFRKSTDIWRMIFLCMIFGGNRFKNYWLSYGAERIEPPTY